MQKPSFALHRETVYRRWNSEALSHSHPHSVVSLSSRLQVIYALNTKNDEHEEEIESLKEAHEDEVRAQHSTKHSIQIY